MTYSEFQNVREHVIKLSGIEIQFKSYSKNDELWYIHVNLADYASACTPVYNHQAFKIYKNISENENKRK